MLPDMERLESHLPDIVTLQPRVFRDDRGFFLELANRQTLREVGVDAEFVQDNLSRSSRGTVRGLHYQIQQPQGKLVTVLSGRVLDVAVDMRRSSPTFGQTETVELDDESRRMVYVPPGFAHGFCVLSERADFLYKCTDYYAPEHERSVRWDDSELAIPWPGEISRQPVLSEKDRVAPAFRDAETYF